MAATPICGLAIKTLTLGSGVAALLQQKRHPFPEASGHAVPWKAGSNGN